VSGLYSVRILWASSGAAEATVPAGQRWVIKCITATNGTATASGIGALIGSVPVYNRLVPAGGGAEATGLHIVLHSGEKLRLQCGNGITVAAFGYELSEAQ
jgi:hypothetical protein